jgi:chemotaxis protein CheD
VSAAALALDPPPARLRERKVGVADLVVSNDPAERIITYALGSCLGVTVHDPVAGVAGLLHLMLPESAIDPVKGEHQPEMFVDTGIPLLFKSAYKLGAKKERMVVKVAGGAHAAANPDDDRFQIGKRNFVALRKIFWKNGVMITASDVGGAQTSRTMWIDVGSGVVTLKIAGVESVL